MGLTAILDRLCKATCSGAVIDLRTILAVHHQRPALKMIALEYLSIRGLLMHVS